RGRWRCARLRLLPPGTAVAFARSRGSSRAVRRGGARGGRGGSCPRGCAGRASSAAAQPSPNTPFRLGGIGGVAVADHITPAGVELDCEADTTGLLGGDQTGARAGEG